MENPRNWREKTVRQGFRAEIKIDEKGFVVLNMPGNGCILTGDNERDVEVLRDKGFDDEWISGLLFWRDTAIASKTSISLGEVR